MCIEVKIESGWKKMVLIGMIPLFFDEGGKLLRSFNTLIA